MEFVLRDALLLGIAVAATFRIRDLVLAEAPATTAAERRAARIGLAVMKIAVAFLILLTLFDVGRAVF